MTPTTPTTPGTPYPRLPELDSRQAGEALEAYGLRALQFVVTHGVTATLDDDALQLATYCYRVAIANRDLLPATIDALAAADRLVGATLRRRSAEATTAPAAAGDTAPTAAASHDRPNLGPMAPLAPRPIVPTAPTAAARTPVARRGLSRVRVDDLQPADAF